ncbi:MAG: biotin--[acetyl-CoA-carboxylase] ligase [Synergistaceae bacterium]|nr:biotin--[acetyl-CoA-carboxylase] ligase [Synergistaceae bacterium]
MKTKTNCAFGSIIYEYDSLDSTQTEAKRLALSGIKKAVVVAEEQTGGRGRLSRNWKSPRGGGLYVSFLLTPNILPSAIHLMNFAAGLAVVSCLNNFYGMGAALKWPNDVIVEEGGGYRKICGILAEAAIAADEVKYCIVGIGVNCKREAIPPELSGRACALDEYAPDMDKKILLERLADEFFRRAENFERGGAEQLLREYVPCCSTIGKTVRIETDGKVINGTAVGIGPSGELLAETGNGIEKFSSADVIHATIF